MKLINLFIFLILINFSNVAHAEIKTYEGIGEYVMSDFETVEVAKQRAKAYAERNAQEKAGVYISSYTKSENLQIATDEIETMTATILKVSDVKFTTVPIGEIIVYRATVKVDIDSNEIPNWLKRDEEERAELVKQNQLLKNTLDEQDRDITKLKNKLVEIRKPSDEEDIKQEFKKAENGFLSNQKVIEGNQYYYKNDYKNAIEIYTEAINLNPDNMLAHVKRGTAYLDSKNYHAAIADFTKNLLLYPNDYDTYEKRTVAYISVGDLNSALNDLENMIKIDPDNITAYMYRSIIYLKLGKKEDGTADFSKAFSAMSS